MVPKRFSKFAFKRFASIASTIAKISSAYSSSIKIFLSTIFLNTH
jgi:hypothetical protein